VIAGNSRSFDSGKELASELPPPLKMTMSKVKMIMLNRFLTHSCHPERSRGTCFLLELFYDYSDRAVPSRISCELNNFSCDCHPEAALAAEGPMHSILPAKCIGSSLRSE